MNVECHTTKVNNDLHEQPSQSMDSHTSPVRHLSTGESREVSGDPGLSAPAADGGRSPRDPGLSAPAADGGRAESGAAMQESEDRPRRSLAFLQSTSTLYWYTRILGY